MPRCMVYLCLWCIGSLHLISHLDSEVKVYSSDQLPFANGLLSVFHSPQVLDLFAVFYRCFHVYRCFFLLANWIPYSLSRPASQDSLLHLVFVLYTFPLPQITGVSTPSSIPLAISVSPPRCFCAWLGFGHLQEGSIETPGDLEIFAAVPSGGLFLYFIFFIYF